MWYLPCFLSVSLLIMRRVLLPALALLPLSVTPWQGQHIIAILAVSSVPMLAYGPGRPFPRSHGMEGTCPHAMRPLVSPF